MSDIVKIENKNETTQKEVDFTNDQIELIKKVILDTDKIKFTDDELKFFLIQCKRTGLDPFTRQIYATKIKGKMSIQSTIDGLRLIALRSGVYEGQTRPIWYDKDGKEFKVWPKSKGLPYACEIGVYRKEFKEPLIAIAIFDEYAAKIKDYNTGKETLNYMWEKMPSLMISKVAEALALRKAFPNDLCGIYSSDEMENSTNDEYKEKDVSLKEEPKQIVNHAPVAQQSLQKEYTPHQKTVLSMRKHMLALDVTEQMIKDKFKVRNILELTNDQLLEIKEYAKQIKSGTHRSTFF